MKTVPKFISLVVVLILSISFSIAQDYKHPYGLTYKKAKKVTPAIKEVSSNNNISLVGANGALMHKKSNLVSGRIAKNETFLYYFKNTPSLQMGQNYRCKASGSYFSVLHENYKHPATCNYRCSTLYKD